MLTSQFLKKMNKWIGMFGSLLKPDTLIHCMLIEMITEMQELLQEEMQMLQEPLQEQVSHHLSTSFVQILTRRDCQERNLQPGGGMKCRRGWKL